LGTIVEQRILDARKWRILDAANSSGDFPFSKKGPWGWLKLGTKWHTLIFRKNTGKCANVSTLKQHLEEIY
jgi:hypothetical protein